MKILWIDTETTGLNPFEHDIVSLALIVEINNEVKDELYLKIQPINWNTINDEALKVNGFTKEELKTFDKPQEALKKVLRFLEKYVDKYKKNKSMEDKFVLAGYNVTFDSAMLAEWCKKLNYKYLGALIDYHKLDIASLILFLKMHNKIQIEGFKLVKVAEYLQASIQSHDAQSDIRATREIAYKLLDKIDIKG
ncbi:MAG: 3'-5' exonuclease [Candidatus Thorarchaeota archaeon]|jgi:DNA polymerase III epsilon subunit-like protein